MLERYLVENLATGEKIEVYAKNYSDAAQQIKQGITFAYSLVEKKEIIEIDLVKTHLASAKPCSFLELKSS